MRAELLALIVYIIGFFVGLYFLFFYKIDTFLQDPIGLNFINILRCSISFYAYIFIYRKVIKDVFKYDPEIY